jgi:hypothetical protein
MTESQFRNLLRKASRLRSPYGRGYVAGVNFTYSGEQQPPEDSPDYSSAFEAGRLGLDPDAPKGRPFSVGENKTERMDWRTTKTRKTRAKNLAADAGLTLNAWLDRLVDQAQPELESNP